MSFSVGVVSRLAGVTVRTLHHYDQIGLLKASGRSDAGYRRYARFTATYETIAPGLAQDLHDAIKANAARHVGD